jgi:hypothetical protein
VLAQLPILNLVTWGLATLLTLILLGRIVSLGQYRDYPLFTAYLVCNLLQTIVGLYVYQRYGFFSTIGFRTGWTTQSFVVVARALAAAELCHHVLGRFRGVWAMSSRILVVCGALVLAAVIYFGRGGYRFAVMTLEIGLESFIGTWVVGLFCFARYYQVQIPGTIRMLGLGLGLHSVVKILNDAVFERLVKAYLDEWNYVAASGFLAVLAIWIWGLWRPAEAGVSGPVISAPNAYRELMPQVNRKLLELNEQLGQLWHTEPRRP